MQADDLARPARAKIFFSLQQLAATRGARNRLQTTRSFRQPFLTIFPLKIHPDSSLSKSFLSNDELFLSKIEKKKIFHMNIWETYIYVKIFEISK